MIFCARQDAQQHRLAQHTIHLVVNRTQVREEIITNLQATYKETDLFKVFQTGDLANIDQQDEQHATKLPGLLALRAALYSQQFRQLVRDVTGCGELSDKTDCSCNTYAKVVITVCVHLHSNCTSTHSNCTCAHHVYMFTHHMYMLQPHHVVAIRQGGHLLCHDDVIGTRRVSYIVYLTDPDEPWRAADGGALLSR